jgi:acetyl-CoA C-acetyltransferase
MKFSSQEVFIAAYKRTAIGKFMGSLSKVPAVRLGSASMLGALTCTELGPRDIDEVIVGSMFGGLGQAPARQVAVYGNLSYGTICTTINKACSSGMKSVTLGAQSIAIGHRNVIVAGGIENMSLTPYYLEDYRQGHQFGKTVIKNMLNNDGVHCKHSSLSMGSCSERTIEKYSITRKEQDDFCAESYRRAISASQRGLFKSEIVPIEVAFHKDKVKIDEDEEYKKVNYEKIPTLKPVFEEKGTITAANASGFNDGAAMLVLMNKKSLEKFSSKPIARIVSYADYETEPVHFGTAPAGAIKIALNRAGMNINDIELWEINENFSSIAIVNMKILNLDHALVNSNGGAVALGHPFAASGARIICTLISSLREANKKIGCASICNGGGGATAIIVEVLN